MPLPKARQDPIKFAIKERFCLENNGNRDLLSRRPRYENSSYGVLICQLLPPQGGWGNVWPSSFVNEARPAMFTVSSKPQFEFDLEPEFHAKFLKLLERFVIDTPWPKNVIAKSQRLTLSKLKIEGDEIVCETLEQEVAVRTKLTLPLFDSFTIMRCSCLGEKSFLEEKTCHHQYALAKESIKYIKISDSEEDLFALLDSLKSDDELETEASSSALEWNITPSFSVEVFAGGRLSPETLRQKRSELAGPHDWKVIGQLIDKPEFKITRISEVLAFKNVQFKEVPGLGRLEIKETEVELHIRQDEEFLETSVRVQQMEISNNYLIAVDGIAVHSGTVLYIQKLTQKESEFYKSILEKKPRIPLLDKDRLLRHLMNLEAKIPITAEASLAKGSDLPADSNPRVRFSPLGDTSWLIEVLVRPGGGSSFIPGTGPDVVIDVRQKEPCLQKRDFDEETHLAEELIRASSLKRFRGSGARFLTESHDDILDCIKDLNARQTPIEWPKSGTVPKVVEPEEPAKVSLTIADKNLWFEASGDVVIGSEVIALKDLIHALRKEKRFIELPNGAWVKISNELKLRAERLSELLSEESMDLSTAAAWELASLKEAFEIRRSSEKFESLKTRMASAVDLTLPETLNATLRPYQITGFEWLQTLYHRGFGCCLADDMGLGKTLQTIAVILKNKSFGPSLVVSPVSLMHNWETELRRFAPELQVKIWSGAERKDDSFLTKPSDVLLTSYGTLQRDRDLFQKQFWNVLVIDEAQNLKNPATQNWKALAQIPAKWKVALSGTPIENKLEELWAILSAACLGVLGSRDEFKHQFEIPIMKHQSEKARLKLKKRIAPFMLRRLKKDYLTELPPKIEKNLYAVPSISEKNFYEACRLEAQDRIQSKLSDPSQKEKLRFEVLASLQTLRQVACHPILLNPEWPEPSAKEELFVATVTRILEANHKVLVFSQFTRFLTLMRQALEKVDVPSFYLDGATPIDERKSLVERFQKGSHSVFFISLKAGGTGLNLTEADFVIHLDPWWNPAVENQASDRAWRMGQTKPVTVYRIVTEGSIEERILALHEQKRTLSDDFTAEATGNLEGLLDLLRISQPARAAAESSL